MKATELRIGNWVMYSSKIQVNENKIRECVDHPDRFAPIPLTEEWLERFGFNKINHIHNGVIWCHSKIKITWYSNGMIDLRGSAGWQRIYYVHALQNLYHALTGQELTIKE